jgi:hypothetical protein
MLNNCESVSKVVLVNTKLSKYKHDQNACITCGIYSLKCLYSTVASLNSTKDNEVCMSTIFNVYCPVWIETTQ